MCGICGEFRIAPSRTKANWQYLTDLIRRRGPDNEGLWTDDLHCNLGFRRLAIIDLSPTGHQPMLTPDGRWVIVYNGEMYNYPELRRKLEQHGVRFRSTGDTEVVLHSLVQWGTEALDRFNGMFALAFYDRYERSILLARDHAGIKPLYYLRSPQGLVFSSQYDQIIAHPWCKDEGISFDALAQYFQHLAIPAPNALLTNTHMLEAGTWVRLNGTGYWEHENYYQFSGVRHERLLSGIEAYEAVDAAITDAVSRQLISDVPVGTFLSGGIDSPLVAAKASQLTNRKILAFTLATDDPATDESSDAKSYARELGIKQHIELITQEKALAILEDVINSSSEPFADYSLFNALLITKAARAHVKVLLSGDGGDEPFWGYARSITVLTKFSKVSRYTYPLRFTNYFFKKGYNKIFKKQTISRPFHLRPFGDYYLGCLTGHRDQAFRSIFHEFERTIPKIGIWDFVGNQLDQAAYWIREAEFKLYLPEVLLKMDRGSMFNSLEVRVPLLDREVLSTAAQVDWKSCVDLQQGIGKLPLRYVLGKHTKHQTISKRGFTVPMGTWLCGALGTVFEDEILAHRDILGIPFEHSIVENMYARHKSRQENHTITLWLLLALALWKKSHFTPQDRSLGTI